MSTFIAISRRYGIAAFNPEHVHRWNFYPDGREDTDDPERKLPAMLLIEFGSYAYSTEPGDRGPVGDIIRLHGTEAEIVRDVLLGLSWHTTLRED